MKIAMAMASKLPPPPSNIGCETFRRPGIEWTGDDEDGGKRGGSAEQVLEAGGREGWKEEGRRREGGGNEGGREGRRVGERERRTGNVGVSWLEKGEELRCTVT